MLPKGRKEMGVGGPQLERKKPCPELMPSGAGVWPRAGSQPLSGRMFSPKAGRVLSWRTPLPPPPRPASPLIPGTEVVLLGEVKETHLLSSTHKRARPNGYRALHSLPPASIHSLICSCTHPNPPKYIYQALGQAQVSHQESVEKLSEKGHLLHSRCRS